jgi:hypothetical protein
MVYLTSISYLTKRNLSITEIAFERYLSESPIYPLARKLGKMGVPGNLSRRAGEWGEGIRPCKLASDFLRPIAVDELPKLLPSPIARPRRGSRQEAAGAPSRHCPASPVTAPGSRLPGLPVEPRLDHGPMRPAHGSDDVEDFAPQPFRMPLFLDGTHVKAYLLLEH